LPLFHRVVWLVKIYEWSHPFLKKALESMNF
jgi:hypothetical protein